MFTIKREEVPPPPSRQANSKITLSIRHPFAYEYGDNLAALIVLQRAVFNLLMPLKKLRSAALVDSGYVSRAIRPEDMPQGGGGGGGTRSIHDGGSDVFFWG